MTERRFTEVDLRRMLEHASGYAPDIVDGRWKIAARHKRKDWDVIVEPDINRKVTVVVTAYPIDVLK